MKILLEELRKEFVAGNTSVTSNRLEDVLERAIERIESEDIQEETKETGQQDPVIGLTKDVVDLGETVDDFFKKTAEDISGLKEKLLSLGNQIDETINTLDSQNLAGQVSDLQGEIRGLKDTLDNHVSQLSHDDSYSEDRKEVLMSSTKVKEKSIKNLAQKIHGGKEAN
ncbi:hypothetical protein LCGC14_0245610 [marine sediment metagenome]|uniref:Uncharacterized protein n=1 Tax=marine sediment metagenome TaxID=412755 RepID=A0A0F9U638_9ZZZZ